VVAIDSWPEGILQGPSASLEIVLPISFLMGLRLATDPDHLYVNHRWGQNGALNCPTIALL